MKMGDGGFRTAGNVPFATTCKEQVIVGMVVINAGSDMLQIVPMVLCRGFGQRMNGCCQHIPQVRI
jgi:hypothetical protein